MYVAHMISQGLTKIPPQGSLESFKGGWCSWMLIDQDRAKEFETAIRQAADYLKDTNRPAYASDPSVHGLSAKAPVLPAGPRRGSAWTHGHAVKVRRPSTLEALQAPQAHDDGLMGQ